MFYCVQFQQGEENEMKDEFGHVTNFIEIFVVITVTMMISSNIDGKRYIKNQQESAICMLQNHNERDFCKLWEKCYNGEPPKKYCKIRYKAENPK